MPDSKVRTTRPLNLTSEVVVRPIGPHDAECADELQEAVDYVAARPGGPIVVDCSEVTLVSAVGTSSLARLGAPGRHGDRSVTLRHLRSPAEQPTECTGRRP
jgi:anti-anti-sigma regulatory factor